MKTADGTLMNAVIQGDMFSPNTAFYYPAVHHVYGQVVGAGASPDASTFVSHAGCFDSATFTKPCSFNGLTTEVTASVPTATEVMKGSPIAEAHTEACVLTVRASCEGDVTISIFDTSGSITPAVVGVYRTCTTTYSPVGFHKNTEFTFHSAIEVKLIVVAKSTDSIGSFKTSLIIDIGSTYVQNDDEAIPRL